MSVHVVAEKVTTGTLGEFSVRIDEDEDLVLMGDYQEIIIPGDGESLEQLIALLEWARDTLA